MNWTEHPDVEIIRDQWGVPHIYGVTDADVAYGLAWAQAEDDFVTVQEQMMAIKGLYGSYKGKEGAMLDFGIHFMGLREVVEKNYEKEISEDFKIILEAFAAGFNQYFLLNPKEVLVKKVFPVSPHDILAGYLLGVVQMTGALEDLGSITNGTIVSRLGDERGSNAIAISSRRTDDSCTYLAINSHQPMEGWYSWYEAHLISEEGLNITGGTFPGGVTIFHGVNDHLGWAHTVNHADFSDVYKLRMHETKKDHYYFDGAWLPLEKITYRSWVKVLRFLRIPITRKIYKSLYGPTFKTGEGVFAWRYVAAYSLKAPEQWYRMNKAKGFTEFRKALEIRGIPCTNIIYADRFDTLYYISNGALPDRDPKFQWSGILPGDTSATLWDDQWIALDSLPQVLNPESGIVFNTNNTPFHSSIGDDNPKETVLNATMGFQNTGLDNLRSIRLAELLTEFSIFSWEDFKNIKFDRNYPSHMMAPNIKNLEFLFKLDETIHTGLAYEIGLLKSWRRSTQPEDTIAILFIETYRSLLDIMHQDFSLKRGASMTEEQAIAAVRSASDSLIKKFGKVTMPLGEVQRHVRGDINLPIGGGPGVLAAIHSRPYGEQVYKAHSGESFIMMVTMSPSKMEIETINAYGSSTRKDSPHYTDQMESFVQQKLKPSSLKIPEENEILRKYRPWVSNR
ncbi:MAG TPA: penicillin acylase family protein [Saprospiraceae bacterium]|nr:penicillin acylase family protein [Saprospiraceae bacterium]